MNVLLYLVVVAILAMIIMYATDAPRRAGLRRLTPIVKPGLPYDKVPSILTPAEHRFYEALQTAARSEDLTVFTKVRLADLVQVRRGAENWQAHQNRIQQKHVDFVLCSASRLAPVLVVELDDRSHQLPRRQERDALVERIFAAVDLPILRIPAARQYGSDQLAAQIRGRIGQAAVTVSCPAPPRAANQARS